MRIVLLSILSGMQLFCFSQQDSIHWIEPIEVIAHSSLDKVVFSHELLLKADPNRSVADQLQLQSGAYIKSQGTAGLQTLTYKGLGAMHLNISLNGFSLQSSMNGIMDLNLLNAYHYSALLFSEQNQRQAGRQNLGANIGLQSSTFGQKEVFLAYNSAGSKTAGAKWGTKSLQASVLSSWSPNRLNLDNYGRSGLLQNTASEQHSAVIHGLDSLGGWTWRPLLRAQWADRQIPASLGSTEDGAQKDINLMLSNRFYSPAMGRWKFQLNSGIWREQIDYRSELRDQFFSSRSVNINHQLSGHRQLTKQLQFMFGLGQDASHYQSEALREKVFWNRFKTNASIEAQQKRFRFSLNIQAQEYQQKVLGSADLRLSHRMGKHRWMLHLAKVNRLPSLNELYWYEPGFAMGNQKLDAESGYRAEVYYQYTARAFSLRINPYLGSYDNLIQWLGFPEIIATNQRRVLSRGAIVQLSQAWTISKHSIALESSHQWQFSSINDPQHDHYKKQLIFTPIYTANARVHWIYSRFSFYINGQYISRNYITGGNEQYLDPYVLLESGGSFEYAKLRLGFRLENLLNQPYFSVPQRPNLGRTIHFNITYQFSKNNEQQTH